MSASLPSPREIAVLRLVAWGYTNQQIAERLKLSVKTIETHKANAMRKLALRSRIAVVQYAVDHGWLQRDARPERNENFVDQNLPEVGRDRPRGADSETA